MLGAFHSGIIYHLYHIFTLFKFLLFIRKKYLWKRGDSASTRQLARRVPRGELEERWLCRRRPGENPRHAGQACACRLWLGQGVERGGLPVPEAGAHRLGSNNVDHCTRLCHASSVAALLEGVGSGAVSNQVSDVQHAEVVLVIAANPTVKPPGGRDLDQERGQEKGPNSSSPIRAAPSLRAMPRMCCSSSPIPTWPCLNAIMHVIVAEGLVNQAFIRDRTSVMPRWPRREEVQPRADGAPLRHPGETLRQVARLTPPPGLR